MSASWRDRIFTMPVLVSEVTTEPETGLTSTRICNRAGRWKAVSWPSMSLPSSDNALAVCEATLLEVREGLDEPMALVNWSQIECTRLFDLLPHDLCPVPGVVVQTCELIQSIEASDLRTLMADVFRSRFVYERYWTYPASLTHHHAFQGGLAQHSLEVAVASSSIRGLGNWHRDLLLVYAFLHDIGKIWSYADGSMTAEARRKGHETLGYQKLQPALALLRDADASSEGMLDALISGEWKRSCRHPVAALGEIVRAMDRFSAAKAVGNAC
jgi:hypothetical protein